MESDELDPWAMQIVVRVTPDATREDAIKAAAQAVVKTLNAAQESEEGREAVASWQNGRIRKILRRARKDAEWTRALAETGASGRGMSGSVAAVAYLPGRVAMVPKDVQRLQVSGLDLPLAEKGEKLDERRVTVYLNPEVSMSTGKACAQAGHVAHLAWMNMDEAGRKAWEATGWGINLIEPDLAQWEAAYLQAEIFVTDAGFTEVKPGSKTAIGNLPTRSM